MALVLVAVASCGIAGCGLPTEPANDAARAHTARASAEAFFDRYVDRTGRVVRHDQGEDTVSEGQAYALLLAVALDDHDRFALVWSWTRDNLQRPDHLFSWHWDSGVKEAPSAADADLDTARALVLAGRQFADPALTREGVAVGRQILDRETVELAGRRLMLPGSWAKGSVPASFNPSYVSPVATQVLYRASKDRRWPEVERGSRALVRRLSADGMPPDWATVDANGSVHADLSRSTQGWDAVRVPIRHAESCVGSDQRIAGSLASAFEQAPSRSAVSWVARAASRAAAGEAAEAGRAMSRAAEARKRHQSYYGDAWEALGQFMLLDGRLGGCPPKLAVS